MTSGPERRTAIIDLGSNSFRLVVFTYRPGHWWRRTDELYESVRISAGMTEDDALAPEAVERALHTIDTFAHFCRASGLAPEDVRPVATSAIREASNRDEFLARAREVSGLEIRVLSGAEEARYAYLAAANSTTLRDGAVLDLGGGSLQLVDVRERRARASASWRLGSVRMTERFLPGEHATKKHLRALRAHVAEELASTAWVPELGDRLVGVGGTVRNVAAAAQRAAELPSFGVQDYELTRAALDELVAQLAALPSSRRGDVPGIKPQRGDVILAGAAVVQAVMEAGGFDELEVTQEGMREGAFFESYLEGADPPLFPSVREASVRNLAAQYHDDFHHIEHVTTLALQMFDSLAEAGVHEGDAEERELVWAAAMLHDIGMAVDYDDHHKHSRYLILNAGLPGFSPREVALVAQIARYHRKGNPAFGELEPLMGKGDDAVLIRGSALVRIAEQLERSRDQLVREARVALDDGHVALELVAEGDISVSRWAAEREVHLLEAAFGRPVRIVGG